MPLTEAIHEYDSDMNQSEPFQSSFATGPKCIFIGRYHEFTIRRWFGCGSDVVRTCFRISIAARNATGGTRLAYL